MFFQNVTMVLIKTKLKTEDNYTYLQRWLHLEALKMIMNGDIK